MQARNRISLKGKNSLSYNYFFCPAKQAEIVVISLWQLVNSKHIFLFLSLLNKKKYSIGLLPGRN